MENFLIFHLMLTRIINSLDFSPFDLFFSFFFFSFSIESAWTQFSVENTEQTTIWEMLRITQSIGRTKKQKRCNKRYDEIKLLRFLIGIFWVNLKLREFVGCSSQKKKILILLSIFTFCVLNKWLLNRIHREWWKRLCNFYSVKRTQFLRWKTKGLFVVVIKGDHSLTFNIIMS